LEGIDKKDKPNSPEFTYRIKYHIPQTTECEVTFVHADYYEYDKDCVSFFIYHEGMGESIIISSIKGWFCIERQEFDTDARQAALDELKEAFVRWNKLARHETQGD